MKKKIITELKGVAGNNNDLLVNHLLPDNCYQAIGPFVLVDHIFPIKTVKKTSETGNGQYAHPHRGFVSCTYILEGSLTHLDSLGNHATVFEGGVHWFNSGSGAIHEDQPTSMGNEGYYHAVQFWVNLPGVIKALPPEYLTLSTESLPQLLLPSNAGVIRIILGTFGSTSSPLKTFTNEFIFHIRLNPKSTYAFNTKKVINYAAFIPSTEILIDGTLVGKSKIVIFDTEDQDIEISNNEIFNVDIFIFGGEKYTEHIARQGPFIMNSTKELADAYRDFFAGKYGTIDKP
ncbi:pirin family protein [Chryseobacterium sp. M5A1_1a]